MMVEAEATPGTLDLIADAAAARSAPPRRWWPGLEAAKPFIEALCEAQQSSPT